MLAIKILGFITISLVLLWRFILQPLANARKEKIGFSAIILLIGGAFALFAIHNLNSHVGLKGDMIVEPIIANLYLEPDTTSQLLPLALSNDTIIAQYGTQYFYFVRVEHKFGMENEGFIFKNDTTLLNQTHLIKLDSYEEKRASANPNASTSRPRGNLNPAPVQPEYIQFEETRSANGNTQPSGSNRSEISKSGTITRFH